MILSWNRPLRVLGALEGKGCPRAGLGRMTTPLAPGATAYELQWNRIAHKGNIINANHWWICRDLLVLSIDEHFDIQWHKRIISNKLTWTLFKATGAYHTELPGQLADCQCLRLGSPHRLSWLLALSLRMSQFCLFLFSLFGLDHLTQDLKVDSGSGGCRWK